MAANNAADSSTGRFLAELAATVKELDEISRTNLAEERKQPKSVRDRRKTNLIRAMQATS
ncbi:hypothetical protein [Mycolicibacterium sp.]|uniref:hypothetical protein n=1 Tax=Mycolicibacterium sp. TaxID=2320850 RepID=UPI00355F9B67